MSDSQKRLQEVVESLEASMNSLGGSAYPLIDAKVSEDEYEEEGGANASGVFSYLDYRT